jgi:hypothetical protein
MDKAQAKVVQAAVGEAIKAVYAQYGLVVTSSRCTYDDSTFNLTVKANVSDPAAQGKTWDQYAPIFDLPEGGVGKVVRLNQKDYRIVGLDLNRRAYPVRVEEVATGKVVLFKAPAIARALLTA